MRRIVIALIVAVALFVAVDFVAASAAEYQVSKQMRERLSLPGDPDVRITGFPFLLQAARGDYPKVDVYAQKLTVGDLHNLGVHALLYHVRLPFSEVLSGNVQGLSVDDVQGSVLITKDDLTRLLPGVKDLHVETVNSDDVDKAKRTSQQATTESSMSGVDPDQAVRLIATLPVLGKKVKVTVLAVLEQTGQDVVISPRDIRVGSGAAATQLPRMAQIGLRQLFTVRLAPGTLPFGATPTMLKAVDNAIELTGSMRDLVIGKPPAAPAAASN
jgi:LmeA-like phospholipid-binding